MLHYLLRRLVPLLLVTVMGVACGLPSASPTDSTTSDPATAVKQQPLSGTLDGHPFVATTAIAQPDGNGGESITIFTTAATCQNQPLTSNLQILLDVTSWQAGTTYELSANHLVTFVDATSGTPDNIIVSTGRVEVTTPGSTTSNGTLSLRASDTQYGSVEGQVPVVLCGS